MTRFLEDEIADFASSVSWDDLQAGTQTHVVNLILDALTVASAGHAAPSVSELILKLGGVRRHGAANIWFQDAWVDGPTAALINSMLVQAWDYDDVYDDGLVHAMCLVLPAMLAVSQTH